MIYTMLLSPFFFQESGPQLSVARETYRASVAEIPTRKGWVAASASS